MGKTIIKIECKDQKLHLLNPTVIASGGRNEDLVEFSFCPLWDGFEKYVAFYRNRRTVYRVPIVDNQCIIPQEVLAEGGWISIAVFGTNGDILRTSDELKYHIKPGAPTSGIDPSEPTPDLWEQVLNRPIYWDNIANKPFGIETVKGFILSESQPETRTGFGYIYTQPVAELVVGETYTISVNGIEGDFVAQESSISGVNHVGFLASSNAGWAESDFYIWRLNEDKIAETGAHWTTGTYDGTSIEAVSIYGKITTFKKIPKEYLPDDIGNSGGVSSWNDLTDKPFGDVDEEGYILPETTIAIDTSDGSGYITDAPSATPIIGNTYTVKWNGTEYECVAQAFDDGTMTGAALGDLGVLIGGDSTGEPFLVVLTDLSFEGMYGLVAALDGSTAPTLSIAGRIQTVKRLDEKYMPENIKPTLFARYTTSSDGYRLTEGISFSDIYAAARQGRKVYLSDENTSEITATLVAITHGFASFAGFVMISEANGVFRPMLKVYNVDETGKITSGTLG